MTSTPMSGNENNNTTNEETKAAAWGVAYSLLLRILSFCLTQLTIRFTSIETLGKAAVRLELMSSTTLFMGREGFRLALSRRGRSHGNVPVGDKQTSKLEEDDDEEEEIQITNVQWLTIPTGILFSIATLLFHLYSSSASSDTDYILAGILYIISTMIESLSEPMVIECLRRMDTATRASAEALAAMMKSMTVVILSMMLSSSRKEYYSVSVFGVGQVAYAATFVGVMFFRYYYRMMYPRRFFSIFQNVHVPTLRLTGTFTVQSLFKHLLTDGDRFILAALSGSHDQGLYALVSSYGGLVGRLLLKPMEENGRLLFGRYHGDLERENVNNNNNNNNSSSSSSSKENHQSTLSKIQTLQTTYTTLLKLNLYLGLLFSALASNYTSILLTILAGSYWGTHPQAPIALSYFCHYIALMSFNGMTEAFVYAVVSTDGQMLELSLVHGGVGGFLGAIVGPVLVRWGGVGGLILANSMGMILRGGYAVGFAVRYFRKMYGKVSDGDINDEMTSILSLLAQMAPHPIVLLSFVASFVVTSQSRYRFQSWEQHQTTWLKAASLHIGVGIVCVLWIVLAAYRFETSFRQSVKSLMASRKKKTD